MSGGADDPLRTHRRDVTVVFLDLRGYTAFAETAEPEEVMGVLREYHREMGTLVVAHEGTLERFAGDGMMVFFNDPVVVPNPDERAVRMALAMRDRVTELAAGWRKRGYDLDVGLGLAKGFATIGAIGFEGRWDYGAIGSVTNLAFRLCSEARPGQVLASKRVVAAVEDLVEAEVDGGSRSQGLRSPRRDGGAAEAPGRVASPRVPPRGLWPGLAARASATPGAGPPGLGADGNPAPPMARADLCNPRGVG